MFREMRRKDRALTAEEAKQFLSEQSYGVLCVLGDEDYPYGVPVNYAYADDCIYVHGFLEGHKMDAVKKHAKVSFTVFGGTENLPVDISTNYTSAIAFGTASILPPEAEAERQAAFEAITFKYSPKNENSISYIQKAGAAANVIKIQVEQLTGKRRHS